MSFWSSELERDLDWRFGEIAALKIETLKQQPKSTLRIALMRALWVMLYAHYEGFAKFAWELYFEAIQRSAIKRKHLIPQLRLVSLKPNLKRLKGSLDLEGTFHFCTIELPNLLELSATFSEPFEKISNLPPEEFTRLCNDFALPHTAVITHSSKLAQLVRWRHEIAHGQKLISDELEKFHEYENAASETMIELALIINEGLEKKVYRV